MVLNTIAEKGAVRAEERDSSAPDFRAMPPIAGRSAGEGK